MKRENIFGRTRLTVDAVCSVAKTPNRWGEEREKPQETEHKAEIDKPAWYLQKGTDRGRKERQKHHYDGRQTKFNDMAEQGYLEIQQGFIPQRSPKLYKISTTFTGRNTLILIISRLLFSRNIFELIKKHLFVPVFFISQ